MPKSWSEEEKEENSYSLIPTPETPTLSVCIRFCMSWHVLTAGALSPLPNSPLGLHLAKHAVWQECSPRIWRRFNISAVQPKAPCLHVVTSRHGAHLSNFPGSTSYHLKCVQRQDKCYCSGQLLTMLKATHLRQPNQLRSAPFVCDIVGTMNLHNHWPFARLPPTVGRCAASERNQQCLSSL